MIKLTNTYSKDICKLLNAFYDTNIILSENHFFLARHLKEDAERRKNELEEKGVRPEDIPKDPVINYITSIIDTNVDANYVKIKDDVIPIEKQLWKEYGKEEIEGYSLDTICPGLADKHEYLLYIQHFIEDEQSNIDKLFRDVLKSTHYVIYSRYKGLY